MFNEVVDHEHNQNGNSLQKHEPLLYYMQNTFLSSIKHGNPYTISYLNRIDNLKLFQLTPNNHPADKDFKIYKDVSCRPCGGCFN